MSPHFKRLLLTILFISLAFGFVAAQEETEANQDRDARIAWWKDAKFGMFVHWGIYSVTGGEYKGQKLPNSAEWMMARGKIPIAEYQQYANQFNPTDFDADQFVGLAKAAGMKYIVITAKHHDGFAMFGSKANDFNVVDATPFNRDIMKELAVACQKQGLKFGFYYSQAQDWHHPGGFGNGWDKSFERVSSDQYVQEKAVPEVRQLLTDYGPIGIFWWDTPRAMSEESFNSLHSLTKLQSDVLTNDRLGEKFPGDYKTFERQIPAMAPAGKEWEVCMPISGSWGYKKGDNKFKSSSKLIRNLIDIASKGGNYLLNVSPTGKGTLLPEAVERLKVIGQWMDVNHDSIYGTSASPLGGLDWGRCTAKPTDGGTILYLHVFDWPADGKLQAPGLTNEVLQASLLDGGAILKTEPNELGVSVSLPANAPDEYASVIKVMIKGTPEVKAALPTPDSDGQLVLNAGSAFIHNNEGSGNASVRTQEGIVHIGHWIDNKAWLEWEINIDRPGTYQVFGTLSVQKPKTGFRIGPSGKQAIAEVASTGGYGKYAEHSLGTIKFEDAGITNIQINPIVSQWQPMNVRQLRLQLKTPQFISDAGKTSSESR